MAIHVTCPHCAHNMRVPEQFAGKNGRCSKCQTVFQATPVAQAPASPAPSPALPTSTARAPAPRSNRKPEPRAPAPRAPAPRQAAWRQEPEPAYPVETEETGSVARMRARGRGKRGVPAWVWGVIFGVGGGMIALIVVLMVVFTGGGDGSRAPVGQGVDPDKGFDPNRVNIAPPPSLYSIDHEDFGAQYIDEAVEKCQSFRFLPATDAQYEWLQRMAFWMTFASVVLSEEEFEIDESFPEEEQLEFKQALKRATETLAEVQFSGRRMEAINRFAMKTYNDPDLRFETAIVVYCRVIPGGAGTNSAGEKMTRMVIEGTHLELAISAPPSFADEFSAGCRYWVIGIVDPRRLDWVGDSQNAPGMLVECRYLWSEESTETIVP